MSSMTPSLEQQRAELCQLREHPSARIIVGKGVRRQGIRTLTSWSVSEGKNAVDGRKRESVSRLA